MKVLYNLLFAFLHCIGKSFIVQFVTRDPYFSDFTVGSDGDYFSIVMIVLQLSYNSLILKLQKSYFSLKFESDIP